MCPLVSGISTKDSAISVELGTRALDIAVGRAALAQMEGNLEGSATCFNEENDDGVLQKGGHLVIKLLESEDVQGLIFFVLHSVFAFYLDGWFSVATSVL